MSRTAGLRWSCMPAMLLTIGSLAGCGTSSQSGAAARVNPPVAANHGPAACTAKALQVSAQWQGAMGSRIGDMTFKNVGHATCIVSGYPRVDITDAQGQSPSVRETKAAVKHSPVPLAPGKLAHSALRWSNWCGPPASLPLSLVITLPARGGTVRVPVDAGSGVPPCNGPGQGSRLEVRPFERGAA